MQTGTVYICFVFVVKCTWVKAQRPAGERERITFDPKPILEAKMITIRFTCRCCGAFADVTAISPFFAKVIILASGWRYDDIHLFCADCIEAIKRGWLKK